MEPRTSHGLHGERSHMGIFFFGKYGPMKSPFPFRACETISFNRPSAPVGSVDKSPTRGGSLDGWVRLP